MRQIMAAQGDVWDLISWREYRDEGFIHVLLSANPKLRHIVQFKEPAIINVPDRPAARVQTNEFLPPWKQE